MSIAEIADVDLLTSNRQHLEESKQFPRIHASAFTSHAELKGALAALIPATPKDCKHTVATDTSVTGSPPNGRDPWVERWTFDLCGKKAALYVTFTPSPNGGTDWSTTLAK